jgi:hypothetical protein
MICTTIDHDDLYPLHMRAYIQRVHILADHVTITQQKRICKYSCEQGNTLNFVATISIKSLLSTAFKQELWIEQG